MVYGPLLTSVDFVNVGGGPLVLISPREPIGKQQREPKVTNTHVRHWMSSTTIKHHAVPQFSAQQRLNFLYR